MQRSRTILRSTLTNYLRQAVLIVTFMFLTPYTARMMGVEAFGLWSLLWSTVGFLSLLDFGISSSVVKFIADARGKGDPSRIKRITATFFWCQIAVGLVIIAMAVISAPFLETILRIPESLRWTGKVVFVLLATRIATMIPFALFGGILISYDRLATNNILRSSGTILYAILTVIAFQFSPTVTTLATTNIVAHLIANFIIIPIAIARLPELSLSPKKVDPGLFREIGSFSGYSFLIQISSLLYTRVDAMVISRFLSLVPVAQYSVAMRTTSQAILFCRQLSSALMPVVARLKGENDHAAILDTLRKGTKLGTALAVGPLVGLVYLAPDLIYSWMGPEFKMAIVPLQILAIAAIIDCSLSIPADILMMTGHQRLVSITTVAGQIFNFVLTIILVQTEWQITGVAFATLVASFITCNAMLFLGAPRLGYRTMDIYLRSIFPSVIPAIAMTFGLIGLRAAWLALPGVSAVSLLGVVLIEIGGCAIFYALFWSIGLNAKERDYYGQRIFKKNRS
jgi:O-antigen/teichoic acid export membrane protein